MSKKDRARAASPRKSPAATGRPGRKFLFFWLAALAVLAGGYGLWQAGVIGPAPVDFEERVERMQASEELYLDASIRLKKFTRSFQNLLAPDANSYSLFRDELPFADLDAAGATEAGTEIASLGLRTTTWPVETRQETRAIRDVRLWEPLLADVDYFVHAKFFIIDAEFTDPDRDEWKTQMGFHGLARTQAGGYRVIDALVDGTWYKDFPDQELSAAWRIGTWKLTKLQSAETDGLAFEDVLDAAIPDPDTRRRARTNLHEYLVARFIMASQTDNPGQSFQLPHKYFKPPSQDRHAGLAVVDIDEDGLDDYYMMDRWGRNLLLRNRGNGTFEDVAPRYGLDVKDHCSSAIFADFDNDGDKDLFLGRTLERSRYYANENGRYVDRSDRVSVPLPYLVSAITAADVDGDGLLDVYISTYAADIMRSDLMELRGTPMTATLADRRQPSRVASLGPLAEFLSDEDTRHLYRLRTDPQYDYNGYRNAYGPPNVVLKNAGGGRFVPLPDGELLRTNRHTYQATWADYDDDGDPDLYLANDFAPNNMYRNEGGGRFVDATDETGTADIGFGMGVTWGDYDGDGRQDLYVSNMYSKAGNRIVKQVPGINPVLAAMARGNSLFRNEGANLRKVSGTSPPAILVEKAEWCWASQFADFDNDGWLDIHTLGGHYTAPRSVESQVDI